MEVVYATAAELIEVEGWGRAPVDQVLLFLAEGLDREAAEGIAASLGGKIIGEISLLDVYQIETEDSTPADLLATLARAGATDGVEMAIPHVEVQTELGWFTVEPCTAIPNPAYVGDCERAGAPLLRPAAMIGLADAWRMVRASGLKLHPVQVGINDDIAWVASGEFNHPGGPGARGLTTHDMAGTPDNLASTTHGTRVAAVVGADHRVGGIEGVASVLGDKLTMVAADVFDNLTINWLLSPNDPASTAPVTIANSQLLRDADRFLEQVSAGSTIINCSFGASRVSDDAPDAAARRARTRARHAMLEKLLTRMNVRYPQVLIVPAAGNYSTSLTTDVTFWGHRLPNALHVGAVDVRGQQAWFSNFIAAGSPLEIALAAPGCAIVTGLGRCWIHNCQKAVTSGGYCGDHQGLPAHPTPEGRSKTDCGTSFSAPQVSGAAAILRSLKPDLTAAQVKAILVETAATTVRSLNDQTDVAIAAGVGGRILRVDNAVLHVVNLVRQSKGHPALTREQLLAMGGFSTTVAGGPEEYTVRVQADYVGEVGTELTLELVSGKATLGGQPTQTLSAPGEATWTLRRTGTDKDLLTLKVERMPSEVCTIVRVPYLEPSRLGNTTAISIKANVDFARPATPSTYDSGTILTIDIPVANPTADYTYTFGWVGPLLTARHEGENPTTFVTETITAEAAPEGATLLWLELLREERSKGGPLSTWSKRVTKVRFENLTLTETGTAYKLQLDRDELAGRLVDSYRRTEGTGGTAIDSWVVMRCNSLTLELRKMR